jgi:hypothetical protein
MRKQRVVLVANTNGMTFFDKHYHFNIYLVKNDDSHPGQTGTVVNDLIRRNTIIYGEKKRSYTEEYGRLRGARENTHSTRTRESAYLPRSEFTSVYGLRIYRPGQLSIKTSSTDYLPRTVN